MNISHGFHATMTARPAFDADLQTLLAGMPFVPALTADVLTQIRPYASAPVEPLLAGRNVERRELTVPAADGTPIPLTVIRPAGAPTSAAPCVYWMHGSTTATTASPAGSSPASPASGPAR